MNHFDNMEAYKDYYEKQATNHGNDHLTEDYVRIKFALSQIQHYENISYNILELGCQTGGISKYLSRIKSAYLTAIDISQGYINKAKELHKNERIRFYCQSAEDFFDQNIRASEQTQIHFSVIVAMEILEHVICPDTIIKGCYFTLKQGGRLLVTVPDETYVDTLGEHKTVFTEQSLIEMLSRQPFKTIFTFHKESWYFAVAVK